MENKINYPFILMIILVTSIVWLTGFYVFGRPAGDNVMTNSNSDSLVLSSAHSDRTNKFKALHLIDPNTNKQYLEMYDENGNLLYKADYTDALNLPDNTSVKIYWSPTGKYFYFLNYVGFNSQLNIYETSTGLEKAIIPNITLGQLPVWTEEDTAFFQTSHNEFTNRPWGTGSGTGISSIDLSTLKITEQNSATSTEDYYIDTDLCVNEVICTLRITKRYVENEEDWSDYENQNAIKTERIL
ncbi:hypothetical protein KC669_02510 [Candidatus Dojkabacteria bacterium]|uniref:DUF5050 domain-containing protein n=1 Tax=Candidatus Dojkabacteria bacterium TaxID=2099670 RepID=A0A955LA14_9BACT|nr:hypothetical protein [Candidatus Dojkabacteria bacterium]